MASITQFMYAVAVDRRRSFRAAAADCFVTQPTLSMQLRKLEEEFDVVLFDRSRKPVGPTQEGRVLLEQFKRVLHEHDRVADLVHDLHGVVAGEYRLGVIPTMAPYILPALLARFAHSHPQVIIHAEELTTQQILVRLKDESLDGAILATPIGDPKVHESPLAQEDFHIYHNREIEIATDGRGRARLADLPIDRLLVMRDGHCLRTQTLDLCTMDREATRFRRFAIEAGSLSTILRMVEQGPYFTIVPALAASELEAQDCGGIVVEIAGPVPFREVGFVSHRLDTKRAVRSALQSEAKALLAEQPRTRRRHKKSPLRPL